MTVRRAIGTAFFTGVLLAAGMLPAAGAAPNGVSATLAGPNSRPCDGPDGTDAVGTAVVQSAKPKVTPPADHRALRVSVSADRVRPRTTYNVVLAATVLENGAGLSVGCRFWSAGTAEVNGNGRLAFVGTVAVPRDLQAFEVYVGPIGPADIGYTTGPVGVAGL